MARVTNAVARRKRHHKILKAAKGYRGARSRLHRTATDAVHWGWRHAYKDRRRRKRDFRRLWITRVNIAVHEHGLSYSQFMDLLHKANVQLDRKSLAEMAVNDPSAFAQLIAAVR